MAFQILDFASITAGMVNYVRTATTRLTDFSVGSVSRTILEAVAVEIDQLYQQLVQGIRSAIPVATYRTFGFDALSATAATGLIRVTVTASASDITIAAGATFSRGDSSVSYASISNATIAAGDTHADVAVTASTTGVVGNVPAGTSFSMASPPSGFISAVTLAAMDDGTDEEEDGERRARFAAYIAGLARSIPAGIEYGAKLATLTNASGLVTERVVYAAAVEPDLSDSTVSDRAVKIYVHNGVGSTSAALAAQAAKILTGYVGDDGVKVPGYKAAGVPITVLAATDQAVAVTATITVASGYDASAARAAASLAITGYLNQLGLGESFIRAEATALAMATPGVTDIAWTAPTGNVAGSPTKKLYPGTVTVT